MTDLTASPTDLGEATYTRVYDAPRELVFECMTTPEHLTKFWGPSGMSTPLDGIVVELRPGGRFETLMVDDASGSTYPMVGVFLEITPPEVLSWGESEAGGMTTTVYFNDLGDGRTECVSVQKNVPLMFLTPEAKAGMETSFDKFDVYLATLPA